MTVMEGDFGPGAEQGAPVDLIGSVEMVRDTGCTYRQLDFWTRCGYLRPTKAAAGYGSVRGFDHAELTIARRMVALVRVGMEPKTAAYCARNGYGTWP